MTDQKQELMRMLNGKKLKGYHISLQEDENRVVASLTNSAVRKPIDLNKTGAALTISYTPSKGQEKENDTNFQE